MNNGRYTHNLPDAEVTLNEWNRVLTSVDLYQGTIRIWFNGKLPKVKALGTSNRLFYGGGADGD